jgi:nitronate monooxygenase
MIASSFPPLHLKGRELLPVVQGGMGVGVSAHRLAGSVAQEGGVGTIASVDLRRLHPDLMERTHRNPDLKGADLKEAINAANLEALDREVRAAKEMAQGRGMVAVNVMRAVSDYVAHVRQACKSGVDAIVMGAGLPLDLPEMAADHPDVALIPILSDVRGISLLIKKWLRKGRLPDAVIIEHPRFAGGHLGAPRPEDIGDARFDFSTVLPGAIAALRELGVDPASVPLIPAGGINNFEKVQALFGMGAAAIQVGTPFAVTAEGDAHANFKRVLAEAKPEDIVTFMSVAGLPARAVRTPWLENYLRRAEKLCEAAVGQARKCTLAWDCLLSCGLRDALPKAGQFCIDNQLAAALNGDVEKGLFFRGAESLPFGSAIRPVKELLDYLMNGKMPRLA